jgi:hypothetical protein
MSRLNFGTKEDACSSPHVLLSAEMNAKFAAASATVAEVSASDHSLKCDRAFADRQRPLQVAE